VGSDFAGGDQLAEAWSSCAFDLCVLICFLKKIGRLVFPWASCP